MMSQTQALTSRQVMARRIKKLTSLWVQMTVEETLKE